MTSITIPNRVGNIGDGAFLYCYGLMGIYFKGDAPTLGVYVFYGDNNLTVYYLPDASGFGSRFGDVPAVLWVPGMQTRDGNFGVRTNQFGFTISWASGQVVVAETSTDLVNPVWFPLQTNTLTNDTLYFSDPQWTNYPTRFYRIRSP